MTLSERLRDLAHACRLEWAPEEVNDVNEAADELDRLTAELDEHKKSAAFCEKHKPNGGHRAMCLVCACQNLSAALSRISYLCGEPNEMECGPYDVHCNESAVVSQVERLTARVADLEKDAERYRWLKAKSAEKHDFYSNAEAWMVSRHLGNGMGENYFGDKINASIDAARRTE